MLATQHIRTIRPEMMRLLCTRDLTLIVQLYAVRAQLGSLHIGDMPPAPT